MLPQRMMLVALMLFLFIDPAGASLAQDDGGKTTPIPPETTPEAGSVVDVTVACRESVAAIAGMHADLEFPDHLMQENAVLQDGDFDVSKTLAALDHLAVEEGYTLDYVYAYDGMGGYPVLYLRPEDQEPYRTIEDYNTAHAEGNGSHYPDAIRVDDTAESYMQLAALHVMGSQFYLFWHSNYNDYRIVCDDETREAILDAHTDDNGWGYPIPEEDQELAREIDLTPVVEYDYETIQVRVVLFTDWGGFMRTTFTIGRGFPRPAIETESETLVPYDCGIMF